MGAREDFLAQTAGPVMAAERALHNGDPAPRSRTWSHLDPVTLFGAWYVDSGWADVSRTFERLAGRMSDLMAYDVELVAADVSGDLAYTVAYEHTSTSIDQVPQSYSLRVTQVYRREDGEWKLVHRHADPAPGSRTPGVP